MSAKKAKGYAGPDRRLGVRMVAVETSLDQHLVKCEEQGARVEKRLWRVEWLIITSAAAMIGLLCKLAFFSA